jgi:hypothetical protein
MGASRGWISRGWTSQAMAVAAGTEKQIGSLTAERVAGTLPGTLATTTAATTGMALAVTGRRAAMAVIGPSPPTETGRRVTAATAITLRRVGAGLARSMRRHAMRGGQGCVACEAACARVWGCLDESQDRWSLTSLHTGTASLCTYPRIQLGRLGWLLAPLAWAAREYSGALMKH